MIFACFFLPIKSLYLWDQICSWLNAPVGNTTDNGGSGRCHPLTMYPLCLCYNQQPAALSLSTQRVANRKGARSRLSLFLNLCFPLADFTTALPPTHTQVCNAKASGIEQSTRAGVDQAARIIYRQLIDFVQPG